MRKTTKQEQKIMEYLNRLRDSGITNMFNAGFSIMEMFQVERSEADRTLKLWMANFNEEGNYKTIKIEK